MKPLGKIQLKWSSKLAYVVGLITSDGSLSIDGRHINFTSTDFDLIQLFCEYLGLKNKIGIKTGQYAGSKTCYVVQFGDVLFYRWLLVVGLMPNKSKVINKLLIPKEYFYDFLRGCIDGDGSIGAFVHPESRHLQLRVRLVSASGPFLEWVRSITRTDQIKGYITLPGKRVGVLTYAIQDSTKLLNLLYYPGFPKSLNRKYEKAKIFLADVA